MRLTARPPRRGGREPAPGERVDMAPAPPYLPKNDLPRVDGAFNRREREVLGVSHVTRPPSWTAAFEGMGVRPKCADDDPTVKANDATERNGGAAP